MEIRALQAEGRCGSDASQSNGCCMDPAFLQHLHTLGADQARQHPALFQCEISRMYGMLHQAAPVTLVHVPMGRESERRIGNMDLQRQEVAIKGSRLVLFLVLLCLQRMVQERAMEMSSIRQEEEKEVQQANT